MDVIYTGIGQVTKRDLEIAKHAKGSVFIYGVPDPHKDMLLFARDNKIPIVRFRNILEMVTTLRGYDDVSEIDFEIDSGSSKDKVKYLL